MKPLHLAVIGGKLDGEDPVGKLAVVLANELVERGYRVTLLSPAAVEYELNDRVTLLAPYSEARRMWVGLLRYRRWVVKTLADIQPDHTVSLLTTVPAEVIVPATGLLAARIKAARHEPAPIHERLTRNLVSLLAPSVALSRRYERQAFSGETIKAVIALSDPIETEVQASPLREGATVMRAQVPIIDSAIKPSQASGHRKKLARALGLNPDAYWVTLPFRNAGLGGLEPMVRAFKPLIEQGTDAYLLLAGPTRYTHLAWIGQLGLRERVRFVGMTARMETLIAASDLVACPTSDDPVGWTVRPALSTGKPIITTTACDLAESVRQQGGTVLPAPADPQALLEAIREHHAAWQQGGENPVNPLQTPAEPPLADAIESLLEA